MALEQSGVQLIAAGGDVYISTLEKSTTATNTFVSATVQAGGKTSAAGQVMIGALREVGKIATQAFLEAGKAAIGFVKDSVSVAGDFEAGMHKFQAVAGDAVDTKGLEKFKDLFISLGKELPVSTSEVEQAAIEMVSGGIDPAIVQAGALRSTIQFAAASGLSLADAAATSAKFLAGWTSASASTADKVAFLTTSTDALTKAAAASSTTAAELRLGIFNVQGAAQALHAPFTDVVATLAELAPAFESSAQAGTALNVFMTRLEPQTKAATGAMEELGIITKTGQNLFFDAQGGFLGMGNAAQVLKEHLSGLSDEEKISTLHQLFGNDAMKVGNLLMQDGAAGIDAMKAKMDAANGVAKTAELMQSGYNTALENAKGSVEALQITIGSALLPVLTDLLNNVIQPGINAVTDLSSAIMGDDDAFAKLSPTMQDIVGVADILIANVEDIIGVFNDAGAGSSDFAMAIGNFGEDLGLSGNAVEQLVLDIQELISWFQQGGAQSDTLGSAITDLSGIWDHLLIVIKDVAGGYQAIIQAVLPVVQTFIANHGKQIEAFFKTTWDSIIQIVNTALELYDAIVPPILHAIAAFITDHGSEIQRVLSGAWDAITSIITGALETINGVIRLALDLIHGNWQAAWEDVKTILNAQITAIEGFVSGFFEMIAGIFDTSMGDILKLWEHNWNMALELVQKIDWGQVGLDIINGIVSGIEDNASKLMRSLTGLAKDALDAAKSALGISSPSKVFAEVGQFIVQGMMQGFTDAWPSLTAQLSGLADGLADTMARIGEKARDAIGDAFTATSTIDRQIASNLDAIQKIPEGFYRTATINALNNAQDIANKFADPAVGAKFFKMRSDQILEFQKLQQQINNEQDAATKARLIQQQTLILKAQEAEQAAFEAQQSRTAGPAQDIAVQINDIVKTLASVNLTEDQIHVVDLLRGLLVQLGGLPALAGGGPVNANQPYWVGENGPELFFPTMSGTVMPAATSMQLMGGGGTVTNNQSTSYSMPVYTNQSPSVLQQSFAVMRAGMI